MYNFVKASLKLFYRLFYKVTIVNGEKIENAKGVGDYVNGLSPDIFIEEIGSNLGVLGDESEPLLARTLQEITGANASSRAPLSTDKTSFSFETLSTSTSGYFGLNEMYK